MFYINIETVRKILMSARQYTFRLLVQINVVSNTELLNMRDVSRVAIELTVIILKKYFLIN